MLYVELLRRLPFLVSSVAKLSVHLIHLFISGSAQVQLSALVLCTCVARRTENRKPERKGIQDETKN